MWQVELKRKALPLAVIQEATYLQVRRILTFLVNKQDISKFSLAVSLWFLNHILLDVLGIQTNQGNGTRVSHMPLFSNWETEAWIPTAGAEQAAEQALAALIALNQAMLYAACFNSPLKAKRNSCLLLMAPPRLPISSSSFLDSLSFPFAFVPFCALLSSLIPPISMFPSISLLCPFQDCSSTALDLLKATIISLNSA